MYIAIQPDNQYYGIGATLDEAYQDIINCHPDHDEFEDTEFYSLSNRIEVEQKIIEIPQVVKTTANKGE